MICALVIDDYPAMQRVIRRALTEMFGGDVIVNLASTAEDAIALLRAIKFDLVVSDYNLGGSCGAQILDYLRADQPDQVPRFVFFAGSCEIARSIHDKVIDKDEALQFSDRLQALLGDLQMPRIGEAG